MWDVSKAITLDSSICIPYTEHHDQSAGIMHLHKITKNKFKNDFNTRLEPVYHHNLEYKTSSRSLYLPQIFSSDIWGLLPCMAL